MSLRQHRARVLARAAAFAVALALPVAVLAYLIRAQVGPVVPLDQAAITAATGITRDNEGLRRALLIWQEVFNARWVNLIGTLLCLWVWRRHRLTTRAMWAFGTLMVAWALGLGAKFAVQRARPVVTDALSHAPGYSFPSGHAMNTSAAALIVTLLLWPVLGRTGRVVAVVVAVAAVVLTALDRVFLGVHYPSDTLAGIVLGTAIAGGSYLGYVGWNPAELTRPRSAGQTGLASREERD